MIASYFFVSANFRAASGISKAPGTRNRRIAFSFAPERSNPSIALSKSLSVIKELKRETTMAKRLPEASSLPSKAGNKGSGGNSVFSFNFSLCLWVSVVNSLLVREGPRLLISLALKLRCALLQKRCSPFLFIFGRAGNAKQYGFEIQALAQAHLHALVYGFHYVLYSQRSVRNNLRRYRLGARNQLTRSHNFIDQPDAMRFLSRDHLTRQQHLHRNAFAHKSRQPLRPAISWNNSQLHFWLPQLRVLAGQPDRAGHRHLASAAERKSVNASNHRLAKILD